MWFLSLYHCSYPYIKVLKSGMSLILSFCLLYFAMHVILVSLIPKLDVPHSGIQRVAGLKLAVDVILIPISLFLSLYQSPEIWDVPHFVILLIVFCYACHFGVPHSKVGCPTFWDSEGGRSEIGCRCDSYPYITVRHGLTGCPLWKIKVTVWISVGNESCLRVVKWVALIRFLFGV